MTVETELKLAVSSDDLKRIAQLPVITGHSLGKPIRRKVFNTYFDTPERDLAAENIALRTRRVSGQWRQTVKHSPNAMGQGGLFRRGEHEVAIRNGEPDFASIPKEFSLLHDSSIQEKLAPIFETNFWRITYDLKFENGSQVEIAVDSGEATCGELSEPIREVEIELKRGLPDTLFDIAETIADAIDVRLAYRSKAALGYNLADRRKPQAVGTPDAGLGPGMTTEHAFAAIGTACLHQIEANEEVVLRGDDIEGVHQMRIGLRRLRSSLRVFSNVLPRRVAGKVKDELAILIRPLGPARDWDVILEEHIRPILESMPDKPELRSLYEAASAKRAESYEILQRIIHSREYNRTLLEVAAWFACLKWRNVLSPEELEAIQQPLGGFISRAGKRGHKRLLEKGRCLESASDEKLHRLRIAIKRQRYAIEFFHSCLPKKAVNKLVRAMKVLQAELGKLNDIATAGRLLDELSCEDSPELLKGTGFLRGWQARNTIHLRRDLPVQWDAFRSAGKMWNRA